MKKFSYLLLTIVVMCLTSCGGDSVVKPSSVKVNGALSKYFEVVDRDYKLSDGKLSVEFKRIAVGNPIGVSWSVQPTVFVELLDEGDRIKLTTLVLGHEMLVSEVIRDGISRGGFRGAKDGGLTSLEIIA